MSRRRRLVATAAAAAAAVGAISGGLAYATSDRASSEHTATRQQPQDHPAADRTPLISKPVRPFPPPRTPSWTILESGPDAHSFLIQVDTVWSSAGCPVGAKATVTETTTTIRVHTI